LRKFGVGAATKVKTQWNCGARPFENGMPTIQIAETMDSVWMIEDSSGIDEAFLEK
jgi:hypothetical protein